MNRRQFLMGLTALSVVPAYTLLKPPLKPIGLPSGAFTGKHYDVIVYDDIISKQHRFIQWLDWDATHCVDCGQTVTGLEELERTKVFSSNCDDNIGKRNRLHNDREMKRWREAYGKNLFRKSPFEKWLKTQSRSGKEFVAP